MDELQGWMPALLTGCFMKLLTDSLISQYYTVICYKGLYNDVEGKLGAVVSIAQLISKML